MTVGSKRLCSLGCPQLTFGQLDRAVVLLLGLPQGALGDGDLVVLLAQQFPQRPGGDLDGIPLAIGGCHGLDTRQHPISGKHSQVERDRRKPLTHALRRTQPARPRA